MRGYVNRFRLPKKGAALPECEDASWVGPGDGDDGDDYDLEFLRVIVADGASESMLAGRWAEHLVTAFGQAPWDLGTAAGFTAAYAHAVESWPAKVAAYKQQRAARNSPIQWYEEPGLSRGAYSTLLAVEFRRTYWTATALGDTCLFHFHDEERFRPFPLENSADFTNQPALLSSHGTDPEILARHLRIETGDLAAGDTFYLATDALSAWFLKSVEEADPQWRTLRWLDASAPHEFPELIDKLRDDGKIRDDDTTLVRVDAW